MTRQTPAQPRHDIFTEFPATSHAGLIVRYPGDGADRLPHSFADAAERLASTFTGQAPDDALLMPFLYLYRHAIELELKYAIRFAARLRRNNGEDDPSLTAEAVSERLKKKLGHRLMPLLDELNRQLGALGQPPVPVEVRRLLERISTADQTGETFRYGPGLPDGQDHIDFPALADKLKQASDTLVGASVMLDAYEDEQSIRLEEQREFEAEYASDMLEEQREEQRALEAEYAADMRAEFEGWS